MTRSLSEQLQSLPTAPGVYLFHGEKGEVLYVGKAKSLRSRVRSYFRHGGDGRAGIPQLVERVVEIEMIVTRNEVEALHLEQNLIKRWRPPFNIRLRDDKSFPYVAVTVEDEFPRVMFTRERHRRGEEGDRRPGDRRDGDRRIRRPAGVGRGVRVDVAHERDTLSQRTGGMQRQSPPAAPASGTAMPFGGPEVSCAPGNVRKPNGASVASRLDATPRSDSV